MANYCYSDYVVEGKECTLQHLADTINKADAKVQIEHPHIFNLGWILVALGICSEEERAQCHEATHGFGVMGDWYNAKVVEKHGKKVLTFKEISKGWPSFNMNRLSELPEYEDSITGIYYCTYHEDDDSYLVVDATQPYFHVEERRDFLEYDKTNSTDITTKGLFNIWRG